jgi:hypothetical protein
LRPDRGSRPWRPIAIDLFTGELGLPDSWTEEVAIRHNASGSLFVVSNRSEEVLLYIVRGGWVNVGYDRHGKALFYDIDFGGVLEETNETAHVPSRLILAADGRLELQAPMAPDEALESLWFDDGKVKTRVLRRGPRPQKGRATSLLYQVCDTSIVCSVWEGGSGCMTTVYYCDAGSNTGECYLFGTCGSTGGGCYSCGGDDGGGTPTTSYASNTITDSRLKEAVNKSITAAAEKLEDADCHAVLGDFKIGDTGKTPQDTLDGHGVSAKTYVTTWMRYRNGSGYTTCQDSKNYFFTSPGSRFVYACKQFSSVGNTNSSLGGDLVIHEMLHSLGLGENPPVAAEITQKVKDRCD